MFTAEMIVGLWFVPVVLFILIPLSMLCVWSVHRVVGKITSTIESYRTSAEQVQKESYTPSLRTRHAA